MPKKKQQPSKRKQHSNSGRGVWLAVLVGLLLVLGAALLFAHSRTDDTKQCRQTATSVHLSEDASEQYTVAGELCYKGSLDDKTVQVLISGHTYDRTYWDFAHDSETYSYVDAAIDAGYATFNIDRPGVGRSDIPGDPALLTTPSQGYVVHQLVKALRAGDIADTEVEKIVLVGHSIGTGMALYAAGAYGGVDAVVGTAGLSDTNLGFIPALQANFYPANQDPKFAADNLPDGYITTQPGTRGESFYNVEYAEQAVIDADAATKQPGTPEAIITLAAARAPEIAHDLRIPMFFPIGEKDALYCNADNPELHCDTAAAVVDREKQYFPQACIEAYVQPNAGHNGVLHPNAQEMFSVVNDWVTAWVGKTTADRPEHSC